MAASPTTPSPPTRSLTSQSSQSGEILFESYLHKTPPLDKLFVTWNRRYFVLSRPDPYSQTSLDLSYYMDRTMKEKRGTINLSKFVGIRPNVKIGNKKHVFVVETEERKYIVRAADLHTKTIWLAKLCELCGQEPVYHVSIPTQPSTEGGDGILKFSMGKATVMSPSSGQSMLDIPLQDIRRVGYMQAYSRDIVWFETCKACKNSQEPDQFLFFTVPSGQVTAQAVTRDVKVTIERSTGAFLILEDTSDTDIAYIARHHYGCSSYPQTAKNRIIYSGLTNNTTPPPIELLRRPSEPVMMNMGISLDEYVTSKPVSRRGTISTFSPTAATHNRSFFGGGSRGPTSLNRIKTSITSQNSLETTEEVSTPASDSVFESFDSGTRKKQGSFSSRSSTGSAGSIPPQEDDEPSNNNITRSKMLSRSRPDLTTSCSRPNVPPRSPASLAITRVDSGPINNYDRLQ